jgi:hypothetical protein
MLRTDLMGTPLFFQMLLRDDLDLTPAMRKELLEKYEKYVKYAKQIRK